MSTTPTKFDSAPEFKYQEIFRQTGLSDKESRVYELLLTHGQMGVQQIIKYAADLKRTSLYAVLYALRDHGLVEQTMRGGKIQFKPRDPAAIGQFIHAQKSNLNQAERMIEAVMPSLSDLIKLASDKPVVRVYEGFAGIKAIYEDTLKEEQPILSFLGLAESHPEIARWLRTSYVKRRVSQKIPAEVIISVDNKDQETRDYIARGSAELRQTRIVKARTFPARLEFQVYGHKVSFADYNKKDAPVGVIIDNKFIADTMRSLFALAWASSER